MIFKFLRSSLLSTSINNEVSRVGVCRQRYFASVKIDHDVVQSERYEPVIGLEVHAQIKSTSKLFSRAQTEFTSRPNSQVAYFDLSLPGTLPVLNRQCVEMAVRTGLALNCTISKRSTFDRKHYFYGDMPNGYQITQQRNPIASNGWIEFIVYDEYFERKRSMAPYLKRCRLKQIQLEQDSGKSLVDSETNQSLIDLNRAGIPLMEFVFEPDLRSPLEAVALVRELILILRRIEACSCKMEEGALRVDANISLRPSGSDLLGTRTEVKNLNSIRFIREAIEHEIRRQTEIMSNHGSVVNETMGYDFRSKKTFVMRDKEIVQDYRFMPEPNLPPIMLRDEHDQSSDPSLINITEIGKSISQLPQDLRQQLMCDIYGLTLREAFLLMNDETMRQLFFYLFSKSSRKIGQEICNFQFFVLKPIFEENIDPFSLERVEFEGNCSQDQINRSHLAELADLMHSEQISQSTVVDIIKMYTQRDERTPREIVEEYNWWLIKDREQIEAVCRQVVEMLPKIAKKYAKTGQRKPKSVLIQQAKIALDNQVNEDLLWNIYDKILRGDKKSS